MRTRKQNEIKCQISFERFIFMKNLTIYRYLKNLIIYYSYIDMDRYNYKSLKEMPEDQTNLQQSMITSEEQANTKSVSDSSPKISMSTAIFALMASSLGTGIFNLPLRVSEIGIATFTIYVVLSGIFSYYGAKLIVRLVWALNFSSYSQMSKAAFGKPMKILSQFCIIIFPWGIAICFQVIMAKFLIQLGADVLKLDFYEDRDLQIYNDKGNLARILLNVGIIVTNFLLISRKDMSIIQQLAKIGVLISLYNTFVIFIIMFTGFTRTDPDLTYHGIFSLDWSKVAWFTFTGWQSFSQHVQALSSILFCFVNHQLAFIVVNTLENPTEEKFFKTFKILNFAESFVYLFIGISGYLLLIEHEDVEPIGPMVLTSIPVTAMTIGKFLICFTLYNGIPLCIYPSREVFYDGFGVPRTTRNHYILSVFLSVLSCLIAIAFQKVNSYFGLLGGTAGVMMAGGIPGLCFLKLFIIDKKDVQTYEALDEQEEPLKSKAPSRIKDILLEVFFLLIVVLAVTGAILSVVDPA